MYGNEGPLDRSHSYSPRPAIAMVQLLTSIRPAGLQVWLQRDASSRLRALIWKCGDLQARMTLLAATSLHVRDDRRRS